MNCESNCNDRAVMASPVIVDLQTGCKADTITEAFHPVTTFHALYDTCLHKW